MINIVKVIDELEAIILTHKSKLQKRRESMADQDNSNVSRYITATRWAVEQEIEAMDKELIRLEIGLKEIAKQKGEEKRYFDDYFVTDNFEYLKLGIISGKSELGKDILIRNLNRGLIRSSKPT